MKSWMSGIGRLARVAAATAALVFVSAPPAESFGGNVCAGCHDVGDIECGSIISFVVDSCCGNWINGYSQCVAGYGYAVVCDGGQTCMCNSEGQECDIRMND